MNPNLLIYAPEDIADWRSCGCGDPQEHIRHTLEEIRQQRDYYDHLAGSVSHQLEEMQGAVQSIASRYPEAAEEFKSTTLSHVEEQQAIVTDDYHKVQERFNQILSALRNSLYC